MLPLPGQKGYFAELEGHEMYAKHARGLHTYIIFITELISVIYRAEWGSDDVSWGRPGG